MTTTSSQAPRAPEASARTNVSLLRPSLKGRGGCALPEKPGVYGRIADSTMRPAVSSAIALATGSPAPAPNADDEAPDTTFITQPAKRTKRKVAAFTWTATEPATFTCRLDDGQAQPCGSPFTKRVRSGRRHTFRVTAVDAAGTVEPSPANYSWEVRKPKRR